MKIVSEVYLGQAKPSSGGGGGGGDQHNLGYYATDSALTTAHPTATAGDWAIVGSTDTVWVWDVEGATWVDTGAAGIELPSQTGNAGKFLMTDGTEASWGNISSETTGTLLANGWSYDSVNSRYVQTVNVTGVTVDNKIFVSPYAVAFDEWGNCGVYGSGQNVGTITFWADVEPTNDLQFTATILA